MEDPQSSLAIASRHFDNGQIKVSFLHVRKYVCDNNLTFFLIRMPIIHFYQRLK